MTSSAELRPMRPPLGSPISPGNAIVVTRECCEDLLSGGKPMTHVDAPPLKRIPSHDPGYVGSGRHAPSRA